MFWRKRQHEQHGLAAHLRDGWSEEITQALFYSVRKKLGSEALVMDLAVSVDGYTESINNEKVVRQAYGWAMVESDLPIPAYVAIGPHHDEEHESQEKDVGFVRIDRARLEGKEVPCFWFRLVLPTEATLALREMLQLCATKEFRPSLDFQMAIVQPEEHRARLIEEGHLNALPITRFRCSIGVRFDDRLLRHPLFLADTAWGSLELG